MFGTFDLFCGSLNYRQIIRIRLPSFIIRIIAMILGSFCLLQDSNTLGHRHQLSWKDIRICEDPLIQFVEE